MFLVSGVERRVEGDSVILVHPRTGREERLLLMESRLLPYVNAAQTARMVAERASNGGLEFSEQQVQSLLTRLHTSGFLDLEQAAPKPAAVVVPVEEPANAFEEDQATVVQANSLGQVLSGASTANAFSSTENEQPTSVEVDLDRMLMTGQFSKPAEFQTYVTGSLLRMSVRPRLKATVKFTRASRMLVTVADTETGAHHDFYEVEAMIGRKLDGSLSLAELAAATECVGVSAAQVESVARQWRAYGFFEPFEDLLVELAKAPEPSAAPEPPAAPEPSAAPEPPAAPEPSAAPEPVLTPALNPADAASPPIVAPRPRRGLWLAVFAAMVIGLLTLQFVERPLQVVATFALEPARRSPVRAEADGVVNLVAATAGQKLKPGDLILALDDPGLKGSVAHLEDEIADSESELRKLKAGPVPGGLARARDAANQSATALANARSAQAEVLRHAPAGSKADDAQRRVDAAEKALAAAQEKLAQLFSGNFEIVRVKTARLESLKKEHDARTERVAQLQVRSQLAGTLVTARLPKPGETIRANTVLGEVLDLRTLKINFELNADELGALAPGQSLPLALEKYPGRSFAARVESVGNGEPQARGGRVAVVAVLDNDQSLLREDMIGSVQIEVGQRSLFSLLTRRLKGQQP